MGKRSRERAAAKALEAKSVGPSFPQLDPLFPMPARFWQQGANVYTTSGIVYRSIQILAGFVRSVRPTWVAGDEEREVKLSPIDPVGMLFDRPNPIMGGAAFREILQAYELYHGGYIVALVGASGDPIRDGEFPVSMLPFPIKGWRRITMDGSVGGNQNAFATIGWECPQMASLRLMNHQCVVSQSLDVSGRFGIVSPTAVVSDAASVQAEVDSYQSNLIKNNGRPGIVISTSEKIQKPLADRFIAEWTQNHGGAVNAGRPALLTDADWKLTPIDVLKLGDITNENQFRDSVRKIGMVFGIPEFMYGITENANRASAKELRAAFLTDTVEPMFRRFESVLVEQFFQPFGVKFRLKLDQWSLSAFRDVMEVRLDLVAKYIANGTAVKDAYELVGLPFRENAQSAKVYIAGSLREAAETASAANPPTPPKAPEPPKPEAPKPVAPKAKTVTGDALGLIRALGEKKRMEQAEKIWSACVEPFEPAIADGTTKCVKRMKGYFLKRLSHYLNAGTHLDEGSKAATDASIRIEYKGAETHIPAPEDFDRMMMPKGESVAALQASWRATFADVETATVAMLETELGGVNSWLSLPPEAHRAVALNRLADAIQVDETIRTQLRSVMLDELKRNPSAQPAQIAQALRAEASHVFANAFSRASTIARTEVGNVMGDYRAAVMKAEGVKKKRWASAHRGNTRPSHSAADAQGAIPWDAKFSNGLDRPHDPAGSAAEVINCRCVLIAG